MEKDQKYTITDAPERTKTDQEMDIPAYLTQLELEEKDIDRLKKEFFHEFEGLKKERKDEGLEKKWSALECQYEGKMDDNELQQFNLHRHVTKNKVDMVVRYLKKAFLEPDPKYTVSPRPEFQKEGGMETCQRQEDYLDYQFEEGGINIQSPFGQAAHNATNKGLGLLKVEHDIVIRKRQREETYEGTPEYIFTFSEDSKQIQIVVPKKDVADFLEKRPDAVLVAEQNEGLEEFLKIYPDAAKEYIGYVRKLERGERIDIVVDYDEIVYNNPKFSSVLPRNFYVRCNAEGYDDLINERLTVERRNMSWWELLQKEKQGQFQNIDKLRFEYDQKGKIKKNSDDCPIERADYDIDTYDILEGVFYFKIDETDDDYTRIVCWFDENSKTYLGARYYPYYSLDAYYCPVYIDEHEPGFYKKSLSEYLTDTNVAENALLNFILEAMWSANMVTPIVDEDSDIADQFASNTWRHGMPLVKNKNEEKPDFLQRYMKHPDVGGTVTMIQLLSRWDDDTSGVSSYLTGRESPADPDAPAKKTLALLKQSGINIEDYVKAAIPAANWIAHATLSITHQMSLEGRKYRPRAENVVGEDPFDEISRSEMRARTNIQSQAASFNIDRQMEKELDVTLYQLVRGEQIVAQNPQAVYSLLKNIIKGWSPKWKNMVEQILPSPEKLSQMQLQATVAGVKGYIMEKQAEANAGMPVEPDARELIAVVGKQLSQLVNPPEEEEE
jgi:hypothetical protein